MIKSVAFFLGTIVATSAASAVTYTSIAGAPDPGIGAGNMIIDNFNSTMPPPGVSLTGSFAYKTGTTSGVAAAPAGDTTQFLYVSPAFSTNTATLTSGQDLSRISFYWGSIDKYNTVDVLGAGGVTLLSLNGSMLPPANGDQGLSVTNRRVFFKAGAGEVITGLKFISTGVAFEFDDVAGRAAGSGSGSTVPEPAAWTLMVAGFGLVGFASRRRVHMTSVTA